MSARRIQDAFRAAAADERAALIAFLVAGDPSLDTTVDIARAAVDAGADVIELGVPFSDPLADGPVIQAAYTRALAGGATLRGVIACAGRVAAETGVPVVLMSALNPLLAMGVEDTCDACAAAAVSGLIVPDLPVEDAAELRDATQRHDLGLTFLAAPDSAEQRIAAAAEASTGFPYMVRRRGVTGAGGAAEAGAALTVARPHAGVPIALGFGIATPADAAAAAAQDVDGVIVGSALVAAAADATLAGTDPAAAVHAAVSGLARALRDPAARNPTAKVAAR